MKLLKICGIVAGIHVFFLLFIFANPGCSSTTPPPPAPTDPTASGTPAGTATSPISAAPSAAGAGASSSGTSPTSFDPAAALTSGARYSPTRPGTAAASAVQRQPVADVTPAATYTVLSGDTLSGIAKKNHLTAGALASANNLKVTSPLRPGQKLIVPTKVSPATKMEVASGASAAAAMSPGDSTARASTEPVKHTVKPGETLGQIARKYGVKSGEIAVANNISDPAKIRAGMELTIPGWQAPGKSTKAGKTSTSTGSTSVAATPRDASLAATPTPTPVPDLDAGTKSAPAADVPVIKVEDSPTPAK